MKRWFPLTLAALLAACSSAPNAEPDPTDHLLPAHHDPQRITDAYAFDGEIRVHGGKWDGWTSVGGHHAGVNWPWASATKQVVAVLVMQEVERGRLALDTPVSTYWPDWPTAFSAPTVRQLLQHQSGLANPDDSAPDANGFPSAYGEGVSEKYCLLEMSPPGGDTWRYNNCDYVMLGLILEQVTGEDIAALVQARIGEPSGWNNTRLLDRDGARDYVARSEVSDRRISGYGTSGALIGPLTDMILFDRALMSGALLSDNSRAILWQGNPALGFMGLGQWSFEAPLRNCTSPVRIIERRGAIANYQVRNLILPDSDIAIAIALVKSDFDFGEIWTGSGFMHDMLSAIACR
ncbi:serine hydrolase domain-containing protein [Sphingomicrobium flavum]|uniref:serine hydrolase domain-containing protein n=1 Tax=Sphingomicrobium flavum TaxID=1229164 RepID=UPI0021AE245F|nr:serine hydrolase [Sphingomicrobium flavum]